MMNDPIVVTVDNKLRLRPPPELDKRLRAAHTYANPDYAKAKGLGLFYLPPPQVATWELQRGELCLPRGGAAKLRRAATDLGLRLQWVDRRAAAPMGFPCNEEITNNLEQHEIALIGRQCAAIDALLLRENAYLHASTGFGKTLLVLDAARRAGQRCLFLVPDNGIAKQTMQAAAKLLGEGYAAMLTSKQDPDEDLPHILVATYAMAWRVVSKVPELASRLHAQVGNLVCDEMQFASSRTVHAVVESFPARYRWGMSADSGRKDKREFLAHDSFGQLADHISVQEAVDEGRILHARLVLVKTGLSDPDYEECAFGPEAARSPQARRELYRIAEERVRTDPARNALVAARVAKDWQAGHSCLVLAYRVEHCELIASLIEARIGAGQVAVLKGGVGQKRTFDELCDQLRGRQLRCAVGTPKAYQGLDVPVLDRGYIVVPKATNPQQLEQMMGRFRRVAEGKQDAEVVYFWDERIFPGHKRKLFAQYKTLASIEGAS